LTDFRSHIAHAAPVLRAACAAVLVSLATSSCAPPIGDPVPGAAIQFQAVRALPDYGAVDVRPIDPAALAALQRTKPELAEWREVFAIYAGDTTGLPMFGEYSVVHDTLRFTPRFPPAEGTTYIARYNADALYRRIGRTAGPYGGAHATWQLLADTTGAITAVIAIYPSADVLPMNLLRMYVHFSGPMAEGESFHRIRLYADNDSLIRDPFFTAGESVELWDRPNRNRLTLLFDPGRIKRDLRPHEEAGLPLREGHSYRLVIDSGWTSDGMPLARPFEKRFRVGPMDRTLPRVRDWDLSPPRAASREPLALGFPEPLDHALLQRMITVHRRSGERVRGTVRIGENETRWWFLPEEAWAADSHYVEVDTELEDLAGNNLRKLFDVAPGDTGAIGVTTRVVRIAFIVK
jgi:hypothetical protein